MTETDSTNATGEAATDRLRHHLDMQDALVAPARRVLGAVSGEAKSLVERFRREPIRTLAPLLIAAAAGAAVVVVSRCIAAAIVGDRASR